MAARRWTDWESRLRRRLQRLDSEGSVWCLGFGSPRDWAACASPTVEIMSQRWMTLLGLSFLFLRPIWAKQYASWAFYENQCYGTPYSPTFAMDFLGTTDHTTYPGGHFVGVGDAYGEGNGFAITYLDQCNASVVYYGSGCYNINLGFQPTSFMAWCEPCDDIPAANCANDCF